MPTLSPLFQISTSQSRLKTNHTVLAQHPLVQLHQSLNLLFYNEAVLDALTGQAEDYSGVVDVVVYGGFADVGAEEVAVLSWIWVFELEEMSLYSSHCLIS